jgi:hypothetical protein
VSEPATQPVFVVGGPRSGTTLLAAMLAAHPAFDCGPETHCLSRWARLGSREHARILDRHDWPERATRYVCSLTLGKRPVHALFGLAESDVRSWLASRPPTLASLLESLTAQRATRAGRRRWVEKTPRHLEVPELIASTWPDARIVRIVRDPRDAAVSLTKVPFGTQSLLTNLSVLARMNEAGAAFFRTSPQALTLRYEDLVAEPESELRRLCAFVGEPYDAAMIEGRDRFGRVAAEHEWWKGDATGPLDRSRVGQWESQMPLEVQHYAALNLGGFLAEHRYGSALEPRRAVAIVPSGDALAARYDDVLLRLSAAEVAVERPGPVTPAELGARDPLVFFGVVGQLDPGRTRPTAERVLALAGVAIVLLARRIQGRPAYWVRRLTLVRRHRRDAAERVFARVLQVLTRPAEASDLPRLVGIDDRSAIPDPDGGFDDAGR